MKKFLFVLIGLGALTPICFGQLNVTYTNPNTAVSQLLGNGVTVSNVTYGGDLLQLGLFSGGSPYLGFDQGVILTTGKAELANSTNNGQTQYLPTDNSNPITNDPDLNILQSGLRGVAVLEFDLVSTGELLEFEFVFGSEEYNAYVGSQFNDVFGLFISGPGINGPFSNNAKNLAVIPGTNDYVSINTVNNNSNASYFVDNTNNFGPNTILYNGHTTSIPIACPVQCNETYHIRIAISNVSDHNRDSGVMLRKSSLSSNFILGPITADVQPACEGQNFNLTVQGDNGWTYTWSDGQSGVGLTSITTTADFGSNPYTVTATNGAGCSLTQSVNVVIHPNNNLPPYLNGINNTGEYTAYVQAGEQICFTVPSFDNLDEIVTLDALLPPSMGNAVPGYSGAPHQTANICWTTSTNDIGWHTLTLTAEDDNACYVLNSTYTFHIKVVCDFCPIRVYYENRQPTNTPLPTLTEAGYSITAGEDVDPSQTNGIVSTGNDEVTFKAPEIFLEPGFFGGPGFTAIPDEDACIDECAACCENWNGFTHDYIPNVFTPNGDGVNDVWYLPDEDHPYCAFGAQRAELYIFNRWDELIYSLESGTPNDCCPFEAPAPNYPIAYSSIYWDGTINGTPAVDGTYGYVLNLYGCGGQASYAGTLQILGTGNLATGIIQETFAENLTVATLDAHLLPHTTLTGPEKEVIVNGLSPFKLYPNPAQQHLILETSFEQGAFSVMDLCGKTVFAGNIVSSTTTVDVAFLAKGTYLIEVFNKNHHHQSKFIKQ